MTDIREQIEFLKISGSVLPMGSAEKIADSLERLLAENIALQEQVDSLQQKVHLCARYDQLEAVHEAADAMLKIKYKMNGSQQHVDLETAIAAVQASEQNND